MNSLQIHQTAVVAPGAQIGANVIIGPYAVIEDDVTIDDGCEIASHALVASGSRLGKNVKIHNGAVVGTIPQDLKFGGEKTKLVVGDNTVIREFATLNRGTHHRGETRVGSDCLLMAYSHVAHDCILGDHVIMSNSVNLAGHVVIGDWATLGGLVPVHQFVKIGAHAMIGGGCRVPMDILPYSLYGGLPPMVMGINQIGLKRRGFSSDTLAVLEKTFRILFRSKLNTTQAVERIKAEIQPIPEVQLVLEFIANSERGISK